MVSDVFISRDKVIDAIEREFGDEARPECISAKEVVYSVELADVAPVELAHWIQANDIDETAWRCSKCDLTWILNEGTPSQNEMRYCPKCGAYMVESEGEE